jgi:ABC-type Fe3+/spermidine/putrescine transport system ATPase subunit
MNTENGRLIALEVRNIEKTYEGAPLLCGVSLVVARGEIVCLLGASGSGKTTLLRIITGLEQAESGEVIFEGQSVRDVPVHLRQFGLMFQDLALFPHKNVFDNVAFGLRMQNLGGAEIRARVYETLELVGLAGFAARDVNNLSGGEQQRVALARSLAARPKLLMLDEPLGALDRILREQLVADLRAILKRIGMTSIYVTHDQDEAFAIADRVAIIHSGRVAQIGTPEEIYRAPANTFVARFLGMNNLFAAELRADGRAETALGILDVANRNNVAINPVTALIRPERVRVSEASGGIAARVEECTFRAGKYRARLVTDAGARLMVELDRALAIGARAFVEIEAVEILPP